MTYADYDAIEAMNWSSLRHHAESALAYKYWTTAERPDTAAMLLGRAIHCAVLEPDDYHNRYYVLPPRPPNADGRAKKDTPGKQAYLAWKDACEAARRPGAAELSLSDGATVRKVINAIAAHGPATTALKGRHEVTVTWTDAGTGIACKGRLDALNTRVVDLKTTHKLLIPGVIATEVAQRLYHGQLAYYHDGAIDNALLPADAPPPALVFAQTVPPYDVGLFKLNAEALAAGQALYHELLRSHAECEATKWWPGAAPDPLVLRLPAWAEGMAAALGRTTDWDKMENAAAAAWGELDD